MLLFSYLFKQFMINLDLIFIGILILTKLNDFSIDCRVIGPMYFCNVPKCLKHFYLFYEVKALS